MPTLESTMDDRLLIAFREGSDHVDSADGSLKLLSSDGDRWNEKTLIPENAKYDIRVNHGMTRINGSVYLPVQEYRLKRISPECKSVILKSEDGEEWREVQINNWSPFFYPYGRMFNQDGQLHIPGYFSVGYNQPLSYSVIRNRDCKVWNLAFDSSLRFNEADVCNVDGEFLAVIREETKKFLYSSTSKDGRRWSKPKRLSFTIQSPCLLKVKDRLLLAGRELECRRGKFGFTITKTKGTSIRESPDGGKTWSEPLIIYESYSWDCAYPSMIEHDGRVLCAFYSEFAHGNSDIMLAEIETGD